MSFDERAANTQIATGVTDRADTAALQPDVRHLARQHEPELRRLLLSLDLVDRCHRFGQAASDKYLFRYATSALSSAMWIAGAFIDDHLRGVVELYQDEMNERAEAAFIVERDWRRRGLGWALLENAMCAAACAEIASMRMMFSRHNWAMRGLAAKARGRFDLDCDDIRVDVALGEVRATPVVRVQSEV